MRQIRKLYTFVRPFRLQILMFTLMNLLFSSLSTLSIAIIWPILRVIFPGADTAGPASATAPAPDSSGLAGVKTWFISTVNTLIIDQADTMASLRNLCLFIVGLYIVKNLVKIITNVLWTNIDEGICKGMRDGLFSRLMGQSLGFFNQRRAGDLLAIMINDVGNANTVLMPTFNALIREPIQVILLLVLLLSFSVKLTLIALSSSILSVIMIRLLRTYIKRYAARMQATFSNITARLQEAFQNIRIIKGFSAENHETNRFRQETAWYKRSALKHSFISNLLGPSGEVFAIAALAAVLYFGGQQVVNGQMASAELLTFLFLLFSIMSPVNNLVSLPAMYQRGLVAADRVLAVYETAPQITSGTLPAPLSVTSLRLNDVSFSYRSDREVLRNISLQINKGETIALVGPSGGGKSTLADLLIRFYDPVTGSITLDGHDIRTLDLTGYRSLFGVVTQESILFNDTVRNNIAYNMPDAPDDVVVAAAKAANAHEFITALPNGYGTLIGDRGVLLSGGQRQRLAIARSLVRNPQVLLLDEATSALDSESEHLVQDAIDKLLVGRTAVVIAHRLSTIRKAHRIIVIDGGQLVEQGTHDQLNAIDGVYRRLYDLQFAAQST